MQINNSAWNNTEYSRSMEDGSQGRVVEIVGLCNMALLQRVALD